jgi:hypothetical protein
MKKIILLLCLSWISGLSFGQTRINLFSTAEDVLIWRARFDSGPYKNKSDVSLNSPGDGARINTNATAFRSNPAGDRYDTQVYKGSGYVPRDGAYDPDGCAVKLRDCAFRSLLYKSHPNSAKATQSTADAAAVITELKRIVDQPFSTTDARKCFNWNDNTRWVRIKPKNFQDLAPGFPISEWLTRYLIAAECVKSRMSSADSTKIYQWVSDAAYYMLHNFEEDANDLFVNRPAGNYTITPGFNYTRETDNADVQLMYSTSSAVGPVAHMLSRHWSNRRVTNLAFVGRAGVALHDPYLIGIGKRWTKDWLRYAINTQGDYVDFFRGLADHKPSKWRGYSFLYNLWAFIDELALSGDRELYQYVEKRGSLITSGINAFGDNVTEKTLLLSLTRLANMVNHTVSLYASSTPTSNSALLLDNAGSILDVSLAIPNRFLRSTLLKQTYLRTATGSVPYPSAPSSAGAEVALSVLGEYPGAGLMFANMENVNDRYNQEVVDPGGDTTVVPPPLPPPPIVSHWLQASDTVIITANTHFLNYVKEKALDSDTTGVAARYVTAHSGSDTLTYLFNSARGLDSLQVATGRDRFDAEASYRVEYKHSGTWTSLLDVTANSSTYNRYNINVPSADGVRFIWRDAKAYTRVKYAGVKISAPF